MRKTILTGLVVLGIVLGTKVVQATDVSGDVSGNWILAESPYIVTANATVQNGAILIIDPSVEVRFAQNTSLIVYGTLTAIGTSVGTITFTASSTTPSAGFWQSIKFSGANAKGTLNYCKIGYAKQAVYLENASGIVITHNYIHDNKGDQGETGGDFSSGGSGGIGCGIYLSSSTGNTISGNTISGNTGGQGGTGGSHEGSGGSGGIGCGIYLSSSTNNTISENTISNNQGGIGGTGALCGSGGSGGVGCGIYLSFSTGNTISGNTILGNRGGQGGAYRGAPGQGYGIYIDSNSYNNTIDSSNTYNNEPIHYYYNLSGITIQNQTLTLIGSGSTNLGRIVLINCQNFTIRNNTISGGIGQNGWTSNRLDSGGAGGIGCGIYLSSSTNNIISGNSISNNRGGIGGTGGCSGSGGSGGAGCGIYLLSSTGNTISGNTILANTGGQGGTGGDGYGGSGGAGGIGCGIYLSSSTNNTISGNIISNNQGSIGGMGGYWGSNGAFGQGYGIYIDLNSYNNIIDSSNTYNNEPIHYYYNQSGMTIENQNLTLAGSGSTNLGRIVLINCQNFTIRNNTISGGMGQNGETGGYTGSGGAGGIGCGIYLSSSTGNAILGNLISNNQGGIGGTAGCWRSGGAGGIGCGIYLSSSINNTISGNIISGNIGGQGGTYGYLGSGGGAGGQGYGIYSISNSFPTITYNTLSGNKKGDGTKGFGIYHDGSSGTISATYNWWGDNSGPYHQTSNPSGQGDQVSDWVDYRPWTGIIFITPSQGPIGTEVTIEGAGFATQTLVSIHFGTHLTITTIQSSSSGTFSATFIVDTQPVCTKTITVRDSQQNTAIAYFKLISRIIGLYPSQGSVGSRVTICGVGFASNSSIRLDFGTKQTITTTQSSPNGTFSTQFYVNTQAYGIKQITALGPSHDIATTFFCISGAYITLFNPVSGPVGQQVTLQGICFDANQTITIRFGTHQTITTTTSSSNGTFSVTFKVSAQSPGTKIITASDTLGNLVTTHISHPLG